MCEAWDLMGRTGNAGWLYPGVFFFFSLSTSGLCHPLDLKTLQVTGRLLTVTHIHSLSL